MLTSELIQGMEVARKLKADLRRTPSPFDNRDLLVQRILSSYEKALLILRWNESNSKSQPVGTATEGAGLSPESPISANGSPLRDDIDHHEHKPESKKRKSVASWMDQVRVSSETGLVGPQDDGYSWRKYGQKDILGAKYPRSYYRCTYRNSQNCWATKQVQRSDEDPTIFDITYRGKHTCSLGNNALLPPNSPHQHEKLDNNDDNRHGQSSQEGLPTFTNILSVDNNDPGDTQTAYPFTFPSTSFGCSAQENHTLLPFPLDNDSFLGSLSQTNLFFPTTPESNYFPSPSFQINKFGWINNKQCSESDITDIISANTSSTNSPIPDFDFSLDQVEIDPYFPFDAPDLLS
ncbi:hypothetical protein L6164_019365 [Bauhinia variegata]|uniref:Uncharacterized protein n=1 Tax=Bauhinia variegata TaxID=167791 RepID=A0ACB9MSB7_BAUVA|nr:hypothetical protein L6164_019365 [Bauhinia variegata]